jgi:hypothetical protein
VNTFLASAIADCRFEIADYAWSVGKQSFVQPCPMMSPEIALGLHCTMLDLAFARGKRQPTEQLQTNFATALPG